MSMLRFTQEQFIEHQARIKRKDEPSPIPSIEKPRKVAGIKSKHGNKKTLVDGLKFDSQREAKRWKELKMMEQAGQIRELKRQLPFELVPGVVLNGRKKPAIRYYADFEYMENNCLVVEDCKNPHLAKDPVFRIKQHLMAHVHGIEIKIT